MAETLHRWLETDAAAGENPVKVMIERLEIRLVDGDEPARRLAAEIVGESPQQVGQGVTHKVEEAVDRPGLQPRIEPEPRGINEVVQRDDRLEAVRAAIGDPLRVAVERPLVVRRRFAVGREAFLGAEQRVGLDARPLDAHPEGVEAHLAAALEILARQRPEIGGAAGGDDVALPFRPRPIIQRLAGAVVTALGLVTGGRDAPQKAIGRNVGAGRSRPLLCDIGLATFFDRRQAMRVARRRRH